MSTTEEGKFQMADGFEVYTKTWKPASAPKAVLIWIHGFSDHINRYETVFPTFSEAGITVYGFDQRGWGKSVPTKKHKGLTGPTTTVMDDIAAFVKAHISSSVPTFMAGHSMGGQETLHFIAHGPDDIKKQIKGFILSSPYIALDPHSEPNFLKLWAGKAVFSLGILKNFQIPNPLDADTMSHDPVMNKDLLADPLCHDTGTIQGLGNMLERARALEAHEVLAKDWEGLHMLFLHGDSDPCTSSASTKKYYEKLDVKNKKLKLYPNGFHCLYYEPDLKDEFKSDIVAFIQERTKEEQSGGPQSKL